MKRLLDAALWLAALGVLAFALWPRSSGPTVGTPGAPFALPVLGASAPFEHSGARERPLLIEVFASWCSACQRSSSVLDALGEAADGKKLDVVAVSVDDDASAASAAQRSWPIRVPVLHDERGAFQRAYGVSVLPTYILLGADGRVLETTAGAPGASDIRRWLELAR
jgi:thiol-disulfide isomerase/thioredoxin